MNERCFAIKKNGECKALDVKHCPGCGQCSFYMPVWMYERDRDRAFGHINRLPEARQLEIANKYYGDKMPWKRSDAQ